MLRITHNVKNAVNGQPWLESSIELRYSHTGADEAAKAANEKSLLDELYDDRALEFWTLVRMLEVQIQQNNWNAVEDTEDKLLNLVNRRPQIERI